MSDFSKELSRLHVTDNNLNSSGAPAAAARVADRAVDNAGPILMSPGGTFRPSTAAPMPTDHHLDNGGGGSEGVQWPALSSGKFKLKRELFGGSITMDLIEQFEDVSDLRPVPDHQEVYVDKLSDTSVIVELLNYEDSVLDSKAAQYYFEDLSQCNEAVSSTIFYTAVLDSRGTQLLPELEPRYPRAVIVGKQAIAKKPSTESADHTATEDIFILLILLRLKIVGTDLLLTVNVPANLMEGVDLGAIDSTLFMSQSEEDGQYSAGCNEYEAATEAEAFAKTETNDVQPLPRTFQEIGRILRAALKSFKIENWALFA